MQLFAACYDQIGDETAEMHYNGNNHIQNFDLGRYILGYTVENLVLQDECFEKNYMSFLDFTRNYERTSLNFDLIPPLTMELAALEGLKL